MNCSTKSHLLRAAAAALASLTAINDVAHAGSNRTWVGPDHSNWNTNENWSPNGLPQVGDVLTVNFAGDNTTFSTNYAATAGGMLSKRYLDCSGTGTIKLYQAQDQLEADQEFIGSVGTAVYVQSGGTNKVNGTGASQLVLGATSTGLGFYDLNFGTLLAGKMVVGQNGTGNLNLSSAYLGASELNLGYLTGSHGSAGQNGGTLQVGGMIDLAPSPNSTGAYALNVGAVTANQLFVGGAGTGQWSQNGGTLLANSGIVVGLINGSSGQFLVGNGAFSTTSFAVGAAGAGTVNQTGGSGTATL